MQLNKINNKKGFTLVESLVATAIFALLAVGIYQAFGSLSGLVQMSKLKSAAVALANEQLEIARNLPYADVGIAGGYPVGKIPYQKNDIRNGANFVVTSVVRSIDDSFDGTIGGTPKDLNPADYKLVSVEITCPSCAHFSPLTLSTNVSPKNLETSSGNGALFVQVIGFDGQAVEGASVKVTNVATTSLVIQDTTNNSGLLQLVDLPPGEIAYQIEVSKSGYSSSRTYAPGESGLAKPAKLNATVLAGQLTTLTFEIDKLSNLQVRTIDQFCQPAGPFSFRLQGSKFMDADNIILRYDRNQVSPASGLLDLINLEWDTYKFTSTDSSLSIVGSFPLQSVFLPPGLTGEVKLLLAPTVGRGLLVALKDGVTGQPLSDVEIKLSNVSGASFVQKTSRGFLKDTDWSGSNNGTDGNLVTNNPVGDIKLKELLGTYSPSGYLISRTFDAGTASTTFYNIVWQPATQASSTGETSVRFQLATSNDASTTTWKYLGPDGTSDSFYTVSGDNINQIHNNQRYLRYKVYLSTENELLTPNLSDVAITYSSECLPFGQVFFSDLSADTYDITATKDGYQPYADQVVIGIDSNWQILEATLNPQ